MDPKICTTVSFQAVLGLSYFLGGPPAYSSYVCNFEGKPFHKGLQLDFTQGQECDFLDKNLTDISLAEVVSQLHHFPALWLWASYLSSLNSVFSTANWG